MKEQIKKKMNLVQLGRNELNEVRAGDGSDPYRPPIVVYSNCLGDVGVDW